MILPTQLLLDANAIFYLDKVNLVFDVISRLSNPVTTELVKGELKVPSWKALEKNGLGWIPVSCKQMCRAADICTHTPALSIQDATLAVIADEEKLTLVTADALLSESAEQIGCIVMNYPEFLDGLAQDRIIPISDVVSALEYAAREIHMPSCAGYLKKYRREI